MRVVDHSGQRFGRLRVVVRSIVLSTSKHVAWHCMCDCGRAYIARGDQLRSGKVTECRSCSSYRLRRGVVPTGIAELQQFRQGTWDAQRAVSRKWKQVVAEREQQQEGQTAWNR